MKNWIPLTIAMLVLSCIGVLLIIIPNVLTLLFNGLLQNQLLSNIANYVNVAVHITVLLFFAFILKLMKEGIWRSIAFITYALMSITFIVTGILKVTDTRIWSIVSAVNLLIMIFFTVQSFLIKNNYLKSAFRWHSISLLLTAFLSMLIPYVIYYFALPIRYVQFTSLIYLLPSAFKIYITYLIYQYLNTAVFIENSNIGIQH